MRAPRSTPAAQAARPVAGKETPAPARSAFLRTLRKDVAFVLRRVLPKRGYDLSREAFRRSLRVAGLTRKATFPLLHPEDYAIARRRHDIVFLLYSTTLWANVEPVVRHLRRAHPGIKLAVAFSGPRDASPAARLDPGVETIAHVTPYTSSLLNTGVVYTPHANLDEFKFRLHRPRGARLIGAPYSLNTLDATFTDDAFDAFDYLVCQGPDHVKSFERLAARRPTLKGVKLVPAGYPKLDALLDRAARAQPPRARADARTVVYAPTHGYDPNNGLVSLRDYGEAITVALLAEGYDVIFRPHGASFHERRERFAIDRICERFGGDPRFSLDRNSDYFCSYLKADFMVTDLSGTGFSFAFAFSKPVIFFVPDAAAEQGFSGLQFESRHRLGASVRTVEELLECARDLSKGEYGADIARVRQENVFNIGGSAAYIADFLLSLLANLGAPDLVGL